MSASRSSSPSLSSVPPPSNIGAKAIGRRPRMSRFLRVLVTITTVVHAPFVVGVAEALRRAGVPSLAAWGVGGALGLFGILAFVFVARGVMDDSQRPTWRVFAIDSAVWLRRSS